MLPLRAIRARMRDARCAGPLVILTPVSQTSAAGASRITRLAEYSVGLLPPLENVAIDRLFCWQLELTTGSER